MLYIKETLALVSKRASAVFWIVMNAISGLLEKTQVQHVYDNKDTIKDITDGALYYHADYILILDGQYQKTETVQIDTHAHQKRFYV